MSVSTTGKWQYAGTYKKKMLQSPVTNVQKIKWYIYKMQATKK